MKKLIHFCKVSILGATALAFFTTGALAQKIHYYYENQKMVLEPVTEKILVKFSPDVNFTDQKALLAAEFLKPIVEPPIGGRKGFITLDTKEGTSEEQIQSYLNRLLTNSKVLSASKFYRAEGSYDIAALTDELLVQLKSPVDLYILESEAAELSLTFEIPEYFNPNLYLVKISKKTPGTAAEVAIRLHESGKFVFAEPNFYIQLKKASNDPLYGQQWALENTGTNTSQWSGLTDADVDGNDAWNTATGNKVRIAIIDDGVELTHPDLGGLGTRMLSGYDAAGTNPNGNNPDPFSAHGTNCAGIAAATKDNGIGVAGVAPNATIMPIRLIANNAVLSGDVVKAFNYALCNGADVASNSWGYNWASSQASNDAIDRFISYGRDGRGGIVLAATHNYDQPIVTWPASKLNVIAVGAASMCNQRKSATSCDGENWGSNYGDSLDVMAPGVKMPTTDLTGTAGYGGGDYNIAFNGTSAATPVAAGVAALIVSVNNCFSGREVREILEQTAMKVGSSYTYATTIGHPNGTWNFEMGYGMVNANDAVLNARSRGARDCGIGIQLEMCTPIGSRVASQTLTSHSIEPSIISYPNPFGKAITFSYELPSDAMVSLLITDALGRKVATLHNKTNQKAGRHELTYTNNDLPAGMYYYTFTVGKETRTFKLLKVE